MRGPANETLVKDKESVKKDLVMCGREDLQKKDLVISGFKDLVRIKSLNHRLIWIIPVHLYKST